MRERIDHSKINCSKSLKQNKTASKNGNTVPNEHTDQLKPAESKGSENPKARNIIKEIDPKVGEACKAGDR